ncbi:MAG: DUF3999 domain-containing protein [Proteobacteria bacterium]|nr:DUF3999 domain-containing protein [Pseudomonadota bacterium]
MKKWFIGLVFMCQVIPVYANDPVPMDFAKGIVLDCEEDASIYRFTIPEFVYEHLTRPDFGDIRVFNSQGEDLPFELKRPEGGQVIEHALPSFPLIVFPIYEQGQIKDQKGVSVHIVTDSSGAVIDVNRGTEGKSDETPANVAFYLIDLSQIEKKPDVLDFSWDRIAADQVTRIRIQGSDDLDHWTPLVTSAVLADIRFAENTLRQDAIQLPFYDSRYLKIEILEKSDPLVIKGVAGQYRPTRSYEDKPRRWTMLPVTSSPSSPRDYLFHTTGHLPIDRIRVTFPQKNTLIRVTLKSKNQSEKEWTQQYKGLLYNLTAKGMVFEKNLIQCNNVSDDTWLLSIDPKGGGMGNGRPMMEAGWVPHTLVFVARGEEPFTLAYGSGRVSRQSDRMENILSGISQDQEKFLVKDIGMKATIELGGAKQLEKPQEPLPWKRIALWGILLGGVCLCAGMALSLYRQMNRPTDPNS